MCFSAGASFGAGILLSAVGIASLKKVNEKSEVLFAAIPFVFGVQQMAEGCIWLSFGGHLGLASQASFTFIFLFFAQIVWPFLVPFSILKLEKNEKRKKILKILTYIGTLVSIYLAYCLINFNVEASIVGKHIFYHQDYPVNPGRLGGVMYLLATILPPFFSGVKRMWTLGTAILISYILTVLFYAEYVISVWCFFAAVISILVLVIVYVLKRTEEPSIKSSILPE